MDLPQLVQRIMFAGGGRLLSAWARSSCSLASARQARKSASASSGEWNSGSFPDRWEQSGARSPAAAAAAGDEGPRAAAARRPARSFAGLRRPVPDKAPAVERGWRKMVGGELQEALQQVTAGGDAGVQDHLPAHRRQPAKNLLQVVPAGVAGHLRIVPAGAEQPTAEKGSLISMAYTGGAWCSCSSSRRTSSRSRSSSSRTVTTIRVWRSAAGALDDRAD